MKNRILNILIAIDQLLYVMITLGHGSPDETMSAAVWRLEQDNKLQGKIFRPILDFIFWFDEEHCKNSFLSEINRKHLPDEYNRP